MKNASPILIKTIQINGYEIFSVYGLMGVFSKNIICLDFF